jgi:hypothetical protein
LKTILLAAMLAALGLAPAPARAQTAAAAPGSGWTFDFTPYIWGVAMRGNVQGGDLPAIHEGTGHREPHRAGSHRRHGYGKRGAGGGLGLGIRF